MAQPAKLNEDWLAVIAGLTLLALVLVGAIPGSVIP
ncbi:cytochrome c biogenesis protein ResB [Mycolicibacterium bacteremicum]|nr:cytochrome c biogenesis protein ResB [Mycolicibacterium bacteremicum]